MIMLNDRIYKSKACKIESKDVKENYFKYMLKNPVPL